MGIVDKIFLNTAKSLGGINKNLWIFLSVLLILFVLKKIFFKKRGKNPFSKASLKPKKELVKEKEKREAVIKQGFTGKKIPKDLDAIVIGSGIGGLSCAAILAKAGQKVLVLEQHDQAGGCCHTFIEKGYEFDVGIHYIGEVEGNTLTRNLMDQVTDGQISWAPVEDCIDRVEFGYGDERTTHDVLKGREAWKSELKTKFPEEHAAIDKYFEAMKAVRKLYPQTFMLKIIPLWLANFIINTGLLGLITDLPKYLYQSTGDFLDGITTNKRLKGALCYSFGDYGTQPREAPIIMQLLLMQHYSYGGYYPVGGSSEIAFHIVPVIEQSGGKVLVRANVTQVLLDENDKAYGVTVNKGGEDFNIFAPTIISAAGIINTYKHLLPERISKKSNIRKLLKKVDHGLGGFSIFVGLDGSNEELGLKATNTWAFSSCEMDQCIDEFLALPTEQVGTTDIPLLFISFPSTKDPTWDERYPGKSNCTIVTLGRWDWFQPWENERVNKRGDEYETLKMRLGEKAWEQTLRYYPQLKDKRVYFDVGTPVTNKYYIGSRKGEIYGLDHTLSRFSPSVIAQLRPTTSIPGLYLTGQDISTCGFAGALYAGLLTSSTLLNRNLINDLVKLTKELKKDSVKKVD